MTLDSEADDENNDDMDNVTSSKSKFFVKFIFFGFFTNIIYIYIYTEFQDEQLYHILKRKVWPYQKFILNDNDLWLGTNLEKTITSNMKVKNIPVWWEQQNKNVMKKLTTIRNNAISMIKKKIECEY